MKKYCALFTAEYEGENIGGKLYLKDMRDIRWLIGASKRLEANKEKATIIGNANRLLIWEATKYANNQGIKEFDLGGYYTGKEPYIQKENINNFKKSFGGKLVTQYIYHKDYSKVYKSVNKIYNIIKK